MIAIMADPHFGVRNNSPKYLEFQEKWFLEEFIPSIEGCNHCVILGDVFESRVSLSPLVLKTVRKLFKELTSVTKTHCIVGNHDIYFRNNRSVHWLNILEDQGVIVYDNPSEVILEDKQCMMLPWVVPDDVKSVEKTLTENKYDILFGHLNINEFEMVKGVAENNGFPPSLFNNCKRVYSGHYHLARKKGNINYIGNPFETTWNDSGESKGFIILDGERETKIVTKNTPKHIKINSEIIGLERLTKELITNNIIRVKVGKLEETVRINYVERLNALEPLSLVVDEEDGGNDLEVSQELESSIKDTMGFLTEYITILENPENIDKKIMLEKIEALYKKIS